MSKLRITTNRLHLIALDLALLDLCCVDYGAVQSLLGANVTRQTYTPDLVYALREAHYRSMGDMDNLKWYTNWEMLNPEMKIIVGSACFKGPPDDTGTVEIGYEIDAPYQNQGYATEAVDALLNWALKFDSVSGVVASVESGNMASKRVLMKVGMRPYEYSTELEWWMLKK